MVPEVECCLHRQSATYQRVLHPEGYCVLGLGVGVPTPPLLLFGLQLTTPWLKFA